MASLFFSVKVLLGKWLLFLRTRGMTRLNLRSQVFEIQIVLDQKDLIAFQNAYDTKQFRLYNFLTRKLFEIRLTIQLRRFNQ